MAAPRRYPMPRSRRLGGRRRFAAVFDQRTRVSRGPLAMASRPNDLDHPRLGISIGRAVGPAVVRNRIKRLLRAAFRAHQYDLPVGYDLVVLVRPHRPLALAEYQKLFTALLLRTHAAWTKDGPSGGKP